MEFDDVGSGDLRELWESYLAETAMGHDVSITARDDDNNWGSSSCGSARDKTTPCVVLRDRLMTDAALGGPRPIKSEHSYSLLASSPPPSPAIPPTVGDNPDLPNTQNSMSAGKTAATTSLLNGHQVLVLRNRIDDMEEECFPAISLNRASGRGSNAESPSPSPAPSLPSTASRSNSPTIAPNDDPDNCVAFGTAVVDTVKIKEEPFSPESIGNYNCGRRTDANEVETVAIAPYQVHFGRSAPPYTTSDSEDDEAEYYQSMELEESNGEPSTSSSSSIAITIANGNGNGNGSGRQGLPPTPPSSASSDSEGAASASCSPERRVSESLRGLLAPRFCGVTGNSVTRGSHIHGHVTRQPIHTPLISCQPKGSTGILTLTEEEKRTLIAEGYPVPTKLPLTKQEEKSLKKVRRKIKNKISAQESRRKKKEYMDGLERRVTLLAQENSSYKDRLTNLEGTNRELMRELQRLQSMLRSS